MNVAATLDLVLSPSNGHRVFQNRCQLHDASANCRMRDEVNLTWMHSIGNWTRPTRTTDQRLLINGMERVQDHRWMRIDSGQERAQARRKAYGTIQSLGGRAGYAEHSPE